MRGPALAALAAAAALTGCGAQAVDDAPSLDEVAAATRADPYRFELTLKGEGLSDPFTGSATGVADPAADRGVIRYSFVIEGENLTLEVRRVDGETYTRFAAPGFSDGWTKESTDEADETVGPFGIFSEPHHAADALARHGRDVEAGPGEQIDGIATTHYRASAPTVEILGAGLTDKRREELEVEIRRTDSETAQVEAWAGADGILRKLELEIPITEEGERGRLITSARFYDFGKPVDVEAPPASELQESSGRIEGPESKPCRPNAAPHTAEAVMAALRNADFTVSASCIGSETTVSAFSDDAEVFCMVAANPRARRDEKDAIVAGNVSCFVQSDASRKLVQRLLSGL